MSRLGLLPRAILIELVLMGGLLLSGLLVGGLVVGGCAPDSTTAPEASEQDPVVARATIDRAVATTGDVLTYTVELNHDPNYEVLLPEPGADIAGFRILDLGSEPARQERGRTIEQRWYRLRADLVGSYILPPLTVRYRAINSENATIAEDNSGNGSNSESSDAEAAPWSTLQTSEIFVEVESVLPTDGEVADIRDIKPISKIEQPVPWAWWAAGGGALLVLALLLYGWWRRGRGSETSTPPRPAHEIAFAELNALRGTDFSDAEAVHRFYFRLSEILRSYVEARFGLNATDLTSEEILAWLDENPLPRAEVLRRFLQATDRVKFADHQPAESEIQADYEDALSYVESTRPTEADEEGESEIETEATSSVEARSVEARTGSDAP